MPTPEPATTRALLDEAATALRAAGITDTPRLDAELLLAHAIGVDRTAVIAHGDAPVGADAATTFRALVERRLGGEPVAYQRGVREFHGIALVVDDRVLIPRPETEQLVDLVTSAVMARLTSTAREPLAAAVRVADVGTGSGAIAIALAVALRKRGVPADHVDLVATDISPDALDVARENAVGHAVGDRMRIVAADLLPPTDPDPWDVIVANLPYIPTGELAGLGPEVQHEPVIALDGGPDGFDVIGRLLDRLPKALAVDGIALFEMGRTRAPRCRPSSRSTCRAGRPTSCRTWPDARGSLGSVARERRMTAPLFPIRLVALDIDGTLIGDDLVIGERTRRAIRAALDRDVAVTLVTGRMVSSAMRFARELDLSIPVVGYQGGLIRAIPPVDSPRLGRLLYHSPLAAPVARDIIDWTRANGLDPHVNHLERFILRADDPNADDYSAFMGARAELVDDLREAITHPVTKVLAVGVPPMPVDLAVPARAAFAGRADVTISHPKFLEFVAPGVSKGRAVRWLSRHLRVPLGAVLAIGDQWNDLEMLKEVGHGAAMPSAPAGVLAVARYIAPPVGDEGVAQMIEQLVLARPADALAASDRLAAEALERQRASA